nr:hypothetical protein [uncultured Draconibacterium sp.]
MYLRTRTYTVATDTWSEWVDTYDSLIDIINDITAFPKGIVSYDASENEFKIYLRRAETDKYDGFTLALTSDTSEIKYSHQWRLVGGGLYSYDPDTEVFSLLLTSMTSSENEFAMKFTGKYDYTGGLHGDERIDIDPSSYVKFFIDNKCLTASDLASDFVVECSSFSYIQYSTLHETTEDGVTPIAGHPIVGYHVKRNEFSNSGFFLENTFIANGSHNIDQFHSGLYCMGKDFAQYAFLPNAVLSPELTGTDSQIYADNMNASKIRY